MESANLTPSPEAGGDARLEAFLRGATPTLPDDGFSARVLAALPPANPTPRSSRRRATLCLVGAAAGFALAFGRGLGWPGLQSGLAEAASTLAPASQVFASPLLFAACVVTLVSLLYVFRAEVGDRLTR